MVKRIITGIVALMVFVPILLFSHTWALPIAMGICIAVGTFEAIRCIGQKKNFFLTIPLCAMSMFMPIYVRYSGDLEKILIAGVAAMIAVSLYVFTVAVFANKTLNIADAGLLLAIYIYINVAFSATVYIRDFEPNGKFLIFAPFIIAWVTDTFAYFTGRFFGKHKLIPAVSPKKTVEGAIGGTIFGTLSIVLAAFIIERFFNPNNEFMANYIVILIFGVLISFVGQVGDLIMSVIKRHYKIKDYGRFFPGHGGMLDRFDSALANTLVLAIACTYFDLLPKI